jgi:Homeodomain-like domain
MSDSEVKLSLSQVQRYEVCQALAEGRLSLHEAALALRLSVRQVLRLKARALDEGPQGLVHRNTARPPANKTPDELKQRVIHLAGTTYAHFNFCHLADTLHDEHGILLSDETLRRWLRPQGHGRPPRRGKHRRRRTRRPREGELLFLDGSPHRWFGPRRPPCCLLLASDDATGKPLYGQFQPEEDRDGCFEVCYHVFARFGLPGAFYLDRASQFVTTRHGGLGALHNPDREPTHFETAMSQLKVGLIFAYSPQARGRGERLNGTLQDRLVAELAVRKIADARRATEYLNATFIPRYGRRFGRAPADARPAWRAVPAGIDLKAVLSARSTRTVALDNTVRFEGQLYQLLPSPNCPNLARSVVEVQQRFDGSMHFSHPRHGAIVAKRLRRKGAGG